MGAGHYVAYAAANGVTAQRLGADPGAASAVDGRWFCFNDGSVREMGAAEVQGPAAYILFLVRQDAAKVTFTPIPEGRTVCQITYLR